VANICKKSNTKIFISKNIMAKAKGSTSSTKISFGKRKKGSAKKSFNKHDRTEKNYRGQGK
jgi:hypothetical protein